MPEPKPSRRATAPVSTVPRPKATPKASTASARTATAPRKSLVPTTVRPLHSAIAAAVSPVAALSAKVPHPVVSHRLLEYLVPCYLPRGAVDVSTLTPTQASQLLGDLSVSGAGFAALVTNGTRIRGELTVTAAVHEDLRTVQRQCGAYLTSLRIDAVDAFHLGLAANGRSGITVPSAAALKAAAAHSDPVAITAAAFGQMKHLRELYMRGHSSSDTVEGGFGAVVECARAVLPRLRSLTLVNRQSWCEQSLFRLAVPNELESLSLRRDEDCQYYFFRTFEKPSFGLWRFYRNLRSLQISNLPLGCQALEGMAAGLLSLQRLEFTLTSSFRLDQRAVFEAFPEGLEHLAVRTYGGLTDVLQGYPHLTSVDIRSRFHPIQPQTPLRFLRCDDACSDAAFKKRSQIRRAIRERAVCAAALDEESPLNDLPLPCTDAVESELVPPTLVDLSTGNTPLHHRSELTSLITTTLGPDDLASIGDRFPALRVFTLGFEHNPINVVSPCWAQLRALRVLHLTGTVPNTPSGIGAQLEALHVLDSTLEELAVPFSKVGFFVGVALSLPRLQVLRISDEQSSVDPAITPTMRLAALVHAGTVTLPVTAESVTVPRAVAEEILGAAAPSVSERQSSSSSTSTVSERTRARPSSAAMKAEWSRRRPPLSRGSEGPSGNVPVTTFSAEDVGRVGPMRCGRLLSTPRLLHSLHLEGRLSVAALPGLSLLYPKLLAISARELRVPEESSAPPSIRRWWPSATFTKSSSALSSAVETRRPKAPRWTP